MRVAADAGEICFEIPRQFLSSCVIGGTRVAAASSSAQAVRLPFGFTAPVKPRRKRRHKPKVVAEASSESARESDSDCVSEPVAPDDSEAAGVEEALEAETSEPFLDEPLLPRAAPREFNLASSLARHELSNRNEFDDGGNSASLGPSRVSQGTEPASSSRAPAATTSSLKFQSHVGIVGVSLLKRRGARCLHCDGTFEKGEARLEFAPKLNKPSRSLHASCMAQLPDEHVPQAVSFLENTMNSAGFADVKQRQACAEALQMLRSLHG